MDADLQDSPDEIPQLYDMIMKENYDLVSGWKKKRHDPISKTLPTKIYNWATRVATGIKLHDFNCGLKAYKNRVIKSIEVYGEMHRYIPVMAKWAGFHYIGEKVVSHRKRKYGSTKFGLERFINGFLDLMSIIFVTRWGRKPMHIFGFFGTLLFLAGFVIAVYLAYAKFFWMEYRMTERPLFYFGLLAMILGTQLFMAGFLGELISRNGPDRNKYLIEKTTEENWQKLSY
jgi:glycosyltransferase involved in cell wall biosynthesis